MLQIKQMFICLSENEEDGTSQNGRVSKSEFKDEEEMTAPTKSETTIASSTNTRKRSGMPLKTVDLGAAKLYTGDKSSPDAENAMVKYMFSLFYSHWEKNTIPGS